MKSYLLVFAATMGVSTVLTWVVRGLSKRFGILPGPDARYHIHNQPISRLGGVAIFLTFYCFLLLLYAGSHFGFAPSPAGRDLPKILVPAVLLLATSLLHDLRALRERTKLLVQIHTYDVEKIKAAIIEEGGPLSLFRGEALLVPESDLEPLWSWGLERYGRNSLQTNGTLINDNHIRLFKADKVGVGISVDGPGAFNDVRSAGTLESTRNATAKTHASIERACRGAIAPGLIVTLHRANATRENRLLLPAQPPLSSLPALLQQMRVQLLPTPHPRNRHQKVPPRVTHQPLHLSIVVALARTSELLFKQIVTLQFRECPRLLPLSASQNLRHRQLRFVVENLPRYSPKISTGAHVSLQKCFRRLRRKCGHQAVVRLRQVHGEVARLALHSRDDHPGFSEVHLCLRSASPFAVALRGCSCLLSEWRRSRRSTAPAWAASSVVPASSPAAPNTAASCVRSRARSQTPAPPHARSCLPPTRPVEHVHRSPRYTSLRCPTNLVLSATVRETKIRRSTFAPPHQLLSQRDAVYFCTDIYTSIVTP